MSRDSKKIDGRGWVWRSAGRVAATSGHWPPNPDSGHLGKKVCYTPMRHMDHITAKCRQALLSQSCDFASRAVSLSKHKLAEHIEHENVGVSLTLTQRLLA